MMTSMISARDTDLVSESLSGNRDAFGQIVARYQSLVCSLAFSATGSLGQSEDLAQETFVTAWKQLAGLREPEKLRAWLCGIARNLINNSLRKSGREPSHRAESLDEISESHSPEPLPAEQAISNEELAILWRSLEKIPEIYREPLVLFYREHQSIEAVAQNLELSEDAVKQRLSRGRKLLHEEVLAFVEGALEKTSPGKTFTLGVLAALPMVATSAKAATVGTALAKGGAATKSVATAGSLGGLFAIIGGAYVTLRAQADDTKSPRERQLILQMMEVRLVAVLLLIAAYFGIGKLGLAFVPVTGEFLRAAYVFSIYALTMGLFAYGTRQQQQIQIEENTFVEAEWTMPRKHTDFATNSPNAKSNSNLKAVKFMAFGLALTAVMIAQAPWKQHLGHAILWSALLLLSLSWSCYAWQNRPRYQSLRSGWVIAMPLLIGVMTLFLFNLHQYQAQAAADVSRIASPAEIIAFNFAVVLAYAAFTGIIVWKRKTESRSAPQNKKSAP
jgi:RNA polymerase sigma factor (sigma-70 family)